MIVRRNVYPTPNAVCSQIIIGSMENFAWPKIRKEVKIRVTIKMILEHNSTGNVREQMMRQMFPKMRCKERTPLPVNTTNTSSLTPGTKTFYDGGVANREKIRISPPKVKLLYKFCSGSPIFLVYFGCLGRHSNSYLVTAFTYFLAGKLCIFCMKCCGC